MKRPDPEEIDAAAELLERLGRGHGLSNLRHGTAPGEVVADVEPGRSMFDLVAFEAAVEGRLGWRPDVTSSGAPGADPRDPVGRSTSAA